MHIYAQDQYYFVNEVAILLALLNVPVDVITICFEVKSRAVLFISRQNSNSQHHEVVSHYIFKDSLNLQIIVFICISLT